MVQTKDGRPLDILMTSAGIVSRVNPAQIIETAAAKVAEKTGERILMPSLSGRNNVAWAKKLLKDHDLTDKEVVHNPITGKDIVGPDGKGVMVGVSVGGIVVGVGVNRAGSGVLVGGGWLAGLGTGQCGEVAVAIVAGEVGFGGGVVGQPEEGGVGVAEVEASTVVMATPNWSGSTRPSCGM